MALTTKLNLVDAKFYQQDGGTLTLSGDTRIAGVGTLQYLSDQSGAFTARSVPDAAWVTGKTSALLVNATNGLNKTGPNIGLGGGLTGNTIIYNNDKCIEFASDDAHYNAYLTIDLKTGYTSVFSAYSSNPEALPEYWMLAGSEQGICLEHQQSNCCFAALCVQNNMVAFNYRSDSDCRGAFFDKNGLKYSADYSTCFVNRSLVDAAYVTGRTSQSITTAANGLTKVGQEVKLGGTLTGHTIINGSPSALLQYGGDYSAGYTPRTLVDAAYVTGKTSALGNVLTGATNGLSVSGKKVILGGNLCQATVIGLATNHLDFTGNSAVIHYGTNCNAGFSTYANYKISGRTFIHGTGKGSGGGGNVGIGLNALCGNFSGSKNCGNIAIGMETLTVANTTNNDNIAIGTSSAHNVIGSGNVALGQCTMNSLIGAGAAACNVAIGFRTMRGNTSAITGVDNVALGQCAMLAISSGNNNVALGNSTLGNVTTGANNIALGQCALCNLTTGANNVAIGCHAGHSMIIGSKNVFIGQCAGYNEIGNNKLYIANCASCTLICGDFTGKTVTLDAKLTLNQAPTAGSVSDLVLVRNSGGEVRTVSIGTITGATAISAVNGLTKTGSQIKLGGALCEVTSLSATSHNNCLLIQAPTCACDMHVIGFHAGAAPSYKEGQLYYANCQLNFDREVSGVTLQIGEELVGRAYNQTGTLLDGDVVYVCGAYGGVPAVARAIANDQMIARRTVGVVTQTIGDNSYGYVTTYGIVHDINTAAYAPGTILYLSPTQAGCFTCVRPSYPNQIVVVGVVTTSDATNGAMQVGVTAYEDSLDYAVFTGYTATTNTKINSKLNTCIFTGYTAATTPIINGLVAMCAVAVSGGTNGLSKSGAHNLKLGGTLCESTTICGTQSLTLGNLNGINLQAANTSDISINSMSNGGVYIKSQSGTVTAANSFTTAVGVAMDYDSASGFAVYDNRAGSNQTGIVYASDYSTHYIDRSLVDKAYVDSVASGLAAKAAVNVATTGNITLSGLTTIDGITLTTGMRVLVKNQNTGSLNGIYSASTGTWGRTADYNFAPAGEVGNGDLIPVLSGSSQAGSIWILTTPDPIVSGNTLTFSVFSQMVGVTAGNGICVTTVGTNKQVGVCLSTTTPGLCFDGAGLEFNWSALRRGLCNNNGFIDIKAVSCAAVGTEIPVAICSGTSSCNLYVDSATVTTAIGTPVIAASNGLTKTGNKVILGGTLTGDTSITGGGTADLSFTNLDSFNLGFDNVSTITDSGTNGGLRYAGDYSANYTARSLVDCAYVNNIVTSGVHACNGLTKVGNTVILGGTLTGNTSIIYGSSRLCWSDGGASCIDIITLNTKVHVNDNALCLCSNNGSTTYGNVAIACDGTITETSKDASGANQIKITPLIITLSGTNSNFAGAQYAADYSSKFAARSLVDAAYVTGKTSALSSRVSTIESKYITGATNGLTKTGAHDIKFGGALTEATKICTDNYGLNVGMADDTNYLCITGAYMDSYHSNSGGCYSEICNRENAVFLDAANSDTLNEIAIWNEFICIQTNYTGNPATSICMNSLTGEIVAGGRNAFEGIKYDANYSANFVANSLVNAAYVTGKTSTSGIQTANNGLTKQGTNVKLGGNLTGNTIIDGQGTNSFTICNATSVRLQKDANNYLYLGYGGAALVADTGSTAVTIQRSLGANCQVMAFSYLGMQVTDNLFNKGLVYTGNYDANFTARSLVDAAYVTGKTSTSGIQTANNGLTKTGTNVRLGGNLTGNTTINLSDKWINFSGANGSYKFSNDSLSLSSSNGSTTMFINADACGISLGSLYGAAIGIDSTLDSIDLSLEGNGRVYVVNDSVCFGGTVNISTVPAVGSIHDNVLVRTSTGEVRTVSGAALGDKNNYYSYTAVTGTVTLNTGSSYVIGVTPSAIIYLPVTPKTGEVFKIKDISGTALSNPITVNGNGKNIDGSGTALINTDYGALELFYNGTNWFSLAFVN